MSASFGRDRTGARYAIVSPAQLGWERLRDRVWRMPDGNVYVFPPANKEVVAVPVRELS
jgi:hypothetical protein